MCFLPSGRRVGETFAGFDDEMRLVKGVTGATEKEFQSLTAVAEKLGRETSFTAKQVAEACLNALK